MTNCTNRHEWLCTSNTTTAKVFTCHLIRDTLTNSTANCYTCNECQLLRRCSRPGQLSCVMHKASEFAEKQSILDKHYLRTMQKLVHIALGTLLGMCCQVHVFTLKFKLLQSHCHVTALFNFLTKYYWMGPNTNDPDHWNWTLPCCLHIHRRWIKCITYSCMCVHICVCMCVCVHRMWLKRYLDQYICYRTPKHRYLQ